MENENRLLNLIPQPVKIKPNFGADPFLFSDQTPIYITNPELQTIASIFLGYFNLQNSTKAIESDQIDNITSGSLVLEQRAIKENELAEIKSIPEKCAKDAYLLSIKSTRIHIIGQPSGIFYGLQTLRQLIPSEWEHNILEPKQKQQKANKTIDIPSVKIEDYPRFHWRGYMFDVCRHFFGVAIVKRMLDLLALHKLNVFHWHLTEDQGWRIEMKKYPKLTEIGSIRKIAIKENNETPNLPDPTKYGGFFTQTEVQEIIEYAQQRFITVVPEIELPGHSMAAITAYPEFSCTGGPFEVPNRWGVFHDVYCPGKPAVLTFLKDVLDETIALFPGDIIHTGGDEVPKDRWENCPDCQTKIKQENLVNEHELQVFVTNYFAQYLQQKGKRLMGWNEILDEKLASNAIGQFWMGSEAPIIKHLNNGRDIVISDNKYVYLDKRYKSITLDKAYSYNPVPNGLSSEARSHILGMEAPLWTERVPNLQRVDFQTFPRLTAFAETDWTPNEKKDLARFKSALTQFNKRLDTLGVKPASDEDSNPTFLNKLKKIFHLQ